MHNQKGFTIIELIVVIAIISVLAAIVTSTVIGYIQKSKKAAISAEMREVYTLGTNYYNANNSFANLDKSSDLLSIANQISNDGYGIYFYDETGYLTYVSASNSYAQVSDPNDEITSECPGKWMVSAAQKGNLNPGQQIFCADSSGFSGFGVFTDNNCQCSH